MNHPSVPYKKEPTMKIYYTPECLAYYSPGHPESPQRMQSIAAYLTEREYGFETPKPCEDEDVLRVHSKDLLTQKRVHILQVHLSSFSGRFPTVDSFRHSVRWLTKF